MTTERPFPCLTALFALLLTSLPIAAALRNYDPTFAPRFQGTTNYFPNGAMTQPMGEIYEFDFQSDGKIVVAGGFAAVNSVPASNIARLNPDGSTDTNFTSKIHPNGAVTSITIDSQNRILITGYFDSINAIPFSGGVARLLASGDLDATFTPNFISVGGAEGARLLADGRYLIFGASFGTPENPVGPEIVRISENGALDASYKIALLAPDVGSKWVHMNLRAAIQPDGKLLLGGVLTTLDSELVSVMRFMPDGSIDPSFHTLTLADIDVVDDLALLPDGRFLLAGGTKITRWTTNGLPDLTFTASAEPFIEAFAVGPNGEISSTSGFSIRWFSSDGAIEQTLSTMNPWLVNKTCIRPRADGSVYIGGGWDAISYGIWKFAPAPETYAEWLTNNIGPLTGPTAPSASLIGDGIANFLRYAFRQTFTAPWQSPIRATADGSIQITFNPSASEATLRLFSTGDLNSPWGEIASKSAGQPTWTTTSPDFTISSQSSGQLTVAPNTTQIRFLTVSATTGP